MTTLYDTTSAYDVDTTYYGATAADPPVIKVEMDLSSTFPTSIYSLDYGGMLAYDTASTYDNFDLYEGWVAFDDITSSVRGIDVHRGKDERSQTYDFFDAGTCTLEIADYSSKFLPDEPLSPYYPNVTPMRQTRITATWSGSTNVIFRGFVDRWDVSWLPRQQYSEVKVTATDATKLLQNYDTTYVGVDGDYAYARVAAMLSALSWPALWTDVETTGGFAQLLSEPSDRRPLLPNLQDYQFAEQGALFISKEGKVTWRNMNSANPWRSYAPEQIFSDSGAAGKVPVSEIEFGIADDAVYNAVSITASLGTEQVRSNATSIATYFERGLVRTDVPLVDDFKADYLAKFILALQAVPLSRVQSISTDPRTSTHAANAALFSELLSPIEVTRTPPGGSTTTYKLFVSGIRHAITPDSWRTSFVTSYRLDEPIIVV